METQRKYAGSHRLSPAARRVVTAALVAATIGAPAVAIATEPDFAAAGIEASEGAYVADSDAGLLGDQLVSADEAVKTTSVQENDATAEVKAPSYEWYTSKDKNATYFEISTAEDLMGLAKITQGDVTLADGTKITKDDFKDKTVALNSDIDLQGITWVDINNGEGTSINYKSNNMIVGYAGIFDGRGHIIKNLVLNDEGTNRTDKGEYHPKNMGLFYSIDGGAVKDVTLDGVTIRATARTLAAPLAAVFAGSISDCHVKSVSVSVFGSGEGNPAYYAYVGGLVRLSGYSLSSSTHYVASSIKDSKVSGIKVVSSGQQLSFGGLAGYAYATAFSHDSVSEVNIDVDNAYNIAGFVGSTDYSAGTNTDSKHPFSTFDSCGVSGLKITASKQLQYTGGFAGSLNRGGKFSDCYVDGFSLESSSETKIEEHIGGFCAQTQNGSESVWNEFSHCRVSGLNFNLVGTSDSKCNVGGFSGTFANRSKVSYCTVEGFVDASKAGSSANVGGFLGDLGWNRGDVEIDECQANVNLTSAGAAGGFVGDASMHSDGAKDFAQRDISLTIKNSTAAGKVTSTSGSAGGFVGRGYRGTYESCEASGEVKGTTAGGFWGEVVPSPYVGSGNDTDVAHDIVIKNSTGADVVYGTKDAGGLIGKANTTPAKSEDGSTKGSKTEVSVDGSTPSKVVAGGKDASLSASVNYTNAESDKGNVKIKDSTGTSATLAPVVPKDDGFVVPDGGATGKDANGKEVKVPAGTLITEDGDVRAPLKLSSSSAKIVAGQSTSFTFTYGGSGNAEVTTSDDKVATVTVKDGAVTVVGVKEGEADITVSFPADGIYSATSATFKVTVTRKSTGGNGGGTVVPTPTKYKVDVADAENGTVKADKSSAAKGDRVTLTATAAEGYRTSAVTVTDASGKAVSLTLDADGTYSFEMPASDVRVAASFARQEAKAFPDVDQSAWYAKGVAFVSSRGIMGGYPDGTFGVGRTLTRAEFAQLLYKRAGGVDDGAAKNETGMADVADSEWYTAAANWAVKNGVVNGYGNADGTRTFGPNDPVTLEQMVAIIANLEKADVTKADASVLGRFVDPGDVSPWFTQSVAWAVQAGLVNGSPEADGLHIRPAEPIMRERVASVIMNAFNKGVLK